MNAAQRWFKLKSLCGHLNNGSQTTVKLYQDDATRTAHITVGKKTYCGSSFDEIIDKLIAEDLASK